MTRPANGNERALPRAPWRLLVLAVGLAVSAATSAAAPATVGADELTALGFKELVAATPVQEKWVQGLPAGRIKSMQRNGRKFYIYPDKPAHRIFVGGPHEFAAFAQRYPQLARGPDAAQATAAYRQKQDAVMRSATERDLSDPFLGATWYDLGW